MSNNIVQFNEEIIKGQIKELVRSSVEETLNELLEAEAEKLTQAARYERNEARQGYRSGHYDRNLTTTSGDVTLHVPRLKGISFETAIIERYRRRESSVEEALIEMYLAGVSVRRVEDITEALYRLYRRRRPPAPGTKKSPNKSAPTFPTKALAPPSFATIAATFAGAPPGLQLNCGIPCSFSGAGVQSMRISPRVTKSYISAPPSFSS